jgi:small-conductance mechanosensitive channel
MRRFPQVLIVLMVTLVLCPRGWAQLPGTGELIKTPEITIGKSSSSTAQKIATIVEQLEGSEKRLIKEQTTLLKWQDDLNAAEEKVKLLTRQIKQTNRRLVEQGADAIDPALLPQLQANLDLNEDLVDTISFLIDTFRREQQEITAGLKQGSQLKEQLLAPPPPPSDMEAKSLDEVTEYLSDVRLSRISLSLLKARRAGLSEELDQTLKEKKREFKLAPLAPFEGDPEGRELTLKLRQEQTQSYPELVAYRKESRRRVADHIEAQLQRVRLDIYEREDQLDQLEARRLAIFEALQVTQDALDEAAQRLSATTERIDDEENKARRKLKRLRLNPPEERVGGPSGFTDYRLWQMEVAYLQHRLYLMDIQRQVESFRAASMAALFNMIHGQKPPVEFHANYAYYVDAERQEKARAELNKRRDAWRQEYAHLSLTEPGPGQEELANNIFDRYQKLLDLYDQIDTAKWEIEWCAELVRHYQAQFEVEQRDAWWYLWRGGVSLAALLVVILLSIVLGRVTIRPLRARRDPPNWMRYSLFLSYSGSLLLLWVGLLTGLLTRVWGSLFGFERFGELFDKVLFSIGDKEVTAWAFVGLLGVIALTVAVNRLVVRFIREHIFTYFRWDLGVQDAIAAVVKYIVLFGGFVMGLEFVGIGLGALALFAGVIGIGIGFGLQAIANNFISGFTLLFERPIKKGDFVDAGGLEGRVESIRARATTLITRDAVSVIIPNSEFVSGRVVNWSHGSETVRLHIPVGVAYGSDVTLVTELLKEVGRNHSRVLKHPAPEVWFLGFGDSSLNFELLVWTRDVELKYHTVSEMNYAIDAIFRANNVTIPFPQRDVHIKDDGQGVVTLEGPHGSDQ